MMFLLVLMLAAFFIPLDVAFAPSVKFLVVFFVKNVSQEMVNCWFGLMVWIHGIPL